MDAAALTALVKEVGVPVALVIYFIWRDARFMTRLTAVMDRLEAFLIGQQAKRGA